MRVTTLLILVPDPLRPIKQHHLVTTASQIKSTVLLLQAACAPLLSSTRLLNPQLSSLSAGLAISYGQDRILLGGPSFYRFCDELHNQGGALDAFRENITEIDESMD